MIKVLSQELINQIAAGEVIERPASVVKELVENSLDAGATKISLEIVNGGLNEIKIIDNGCGMNREDVLLSVEQHATSKISSTDDLFKIQTLGFRGEALASIASVSRFSLLSRRAEDVSGTRLIIENSERRVEEAGCPVGTAVIVKDLFCNVPARKKYLKNVVTEYNHIVDLFLNYSLAHPNVDWALSHNGREVYHFGIAENAMERCEEILGKEVCANLLPVEYETLSLKVSGFVGKPQIARQNKKLQYLFVNSRPVNEFVVSKTIKDSFGQLIPKDLHPVYLLRLTVDPTKIDVNVHPRKLEVRFSEPHLVYQAFYKAITDLIDRSELVKRISFAAAAQSTVGLPDGENMFVGDGGSLKTEGFFGARMQRGQSDFVRTGDLLNMNGVLKDLGSRARSIDSGFLTTSEQIANWPYQYLGQVANAYLIISDEGGIKIIDQHAASERIQYEKLSTEWRDSKVASQRLMFPRSVELSLPESNVLRQNLDLFARLGFEIDEFGASTFLIRQAPILLEKIEAGDIVQEVLKMSKDALAGAKSDGDRFLDVSDDILKMMSCKSAIKFGDKLAAVEAMALIAELFKLTNQYTCVHGRPCIIEFSFGELEKLFHRK